jgi:hypothetical protein
VTAAYPSAVKSFTTKVDFTDTVLAEHVNSLQDEVNIIEANLGTYITTSSGWVGTFDQITNTWNSLKDRIANIEYGLSDSFNTHVNNTGGSIITSTGNGTVSLTIKAKTSQTANLLELQTSSGTVVSNVDPSGVIYTSGKALVPIVYSSSQPSSVPAGTVWVDSTSNVSVISNQNILSSDDGVLILMGVIV